MARKRFSGTRRDNDFNGGIAIRNQVLMISAIAIVITFAVHTGQRIAGASDGTNLAARHDVGKDLSRPLGISWTIETIDNDGNQKGHNSLVLDNDGYPHISYHDRTNNDLKYARWNGTDWVIEIVDSLGEVGYDNNLALDGDGHPHISYMDSLNRIIYYAHKDGSQWLTETVDNGSQASLDLDNEGNPQISYIHWEERLLKHARWDGVDWDIAIVQDDVWVWGLDMALDDQARPHIIYRTVEEIWYDLYLSLYYARWDGQEWQCESLGGTIAPNDGGDASFSISLALDSQGYPHFAHFNLTNWAGWLLYYYKTDNGWYAQDFENDSTKGEAPSLVIGSDDNPHIAFADNYWNYGSRELKYIWLTGGRWKLEHVANTGELNRSVSLALNIIDNPLISYWASSYGGEYGLLMFAQGELLQNDYQLPLIVKSAD
jgi:hypothetical protein